MKYLKKILDYLLSKFSKVQLGFMLALIVFAFFLSESNLYSRFGYDSEISDLKKQIKFYREQKESDQEKLKQLKSDKDNIEKFARENYLMKKADEEVFVVE